MHMKLLKASAVMAVIISAIACSNNKDTFVADFSQYPLCTNAEDSSVVFVNIKNGDVVSKKYLGAYPFYNGLSVVKTAKGWTYVNEDFEEQFGEYYKDATHFSEGLAFTVKTGEHINAINEEGETIYSLPHVAAVYALSEDRAVYKDENKKFGLLDRNGEVVCPAKFDDCERFLKNGTLMVAIKDKKGKAKWGIIDCDGNTLISIQYPKIKRYDEGFTIFKDDRKTAWYDLKDNVVSNYDFYDIVKDGNLYSFKARGGKYGWMNHKGQIVIEPEFDEVTLFGDRDEAFVKMKKRGKEWGTINKKGEWTGRPRYAAVDLTDQYPIIKNSHGEYGVVDYDGSVLIKTNKKAIKHIEGEYYLVTSYDNKIGIMLADGKEEWVAKPMYEKFKGIIYRPSIMVNDDFFDISSMLGILHKQTDSLKKTTVGEILEAYGIDKESLPKKISNLILFECEDGNYSIKVEADKVSAWTIKRDFWEGSKMIFNGKANIKKYLVTVTLKNKYAKDKERIIETFTKEWGMNDKGIVTTNKKTYKLTDISKKSQSRFKIAISCDE